MQIVIFIIKLIKKFKTLKTLTFYSGVAGAAKSTKDVAGVRRCCWREASKERCACRGLTRGGGLERRWLWWKGREARKRAWVAKVVGWRHGVGTTSAEKEGKCGGRNIAMISVQGVEEEVRARRSGAMRSGVDLGVAEEEMRLRC